MVPPFSLPCYDVYMSMFPKTQRLTQKQFDHYFKSGKRFHFDHLTVVYSQSETLHAAVVVGKKVEKRAVKRNMIRRQIYGVLYRVLCNREKTGVYLVLVKPAAAKLTRLERLQKTNESIAAVMKKT